MAINDRSIGNTIASPPQVDKGKLRELIADLEEELQAAKTLLDELEAPADGKPKSVWIDVRINPPI